MPQNSDIRENLIAVNKRIAEASEAVSLGPGDVTLVAISKTHPAAAAHVALEAGHRVFGENRIQEAEKKWPALKEEFPDARLHLVGGLQRNKVKAAVALFDAIQTIDRSKLARAVADEIDKSDRQLKCFIQVNTGEEAQKGGVLPEDADALIAECRDSLNLPVVGLMCIPPADEEPSLHFALLREIAKRNGLESLSMGMSGDFEMAIRFGATHVRVGTGIFGERPPFKPEGQA
ncbi:MAG: YggS family pyridoxal phosphate-dependent enzyme [Rhodospirillales bacterium]|nr:YggS family pyridoxal phosphate-dependent enzyme [Rhodospirillales bacterium]